MMNISQNVKRSARKLVCLASAILLAACSKTADKSPTDSTAAAMASAPTDSNGVGKLTVKFTSDQYKLAGIEVGVIEQRKLSNIIKLNGMIDVEPSKTAVVSAPLGGYIRSAGLLPGQVVRQGQVLATIENPEFTQIQQEYLESKGRMEFLEQEFARQKKLRAEEVNSAKTFQLVESERKIMSARIAGLEQRMAFAGIPKSSTDGGKIARTASLFAPISGFVRISNVNIGKYASPTDVLFEIVDTRDLHLALNAYEGDLGKIKIGQTVRFSMANENSFNHTAKVFLIGQATGDDRVVPIHCHLTGGSSRDLLPGMYAKAWIETGTEQQLAVPSDAIVQLEGKDYVVVQTTQSNTEHVFQLKEIRKAMEQEGYTGIIAPEHFDMQKARIVTKNANAVLAALKSVQEGE